MQMLQTPGCLGSAVVMNCSQIIFWEARWAQKGRLPLTPTLVALTPQLIVLTRPVDAHLEHVEFPALLQRLSPILILHIFASAVLERRLIFLAEELRSVLGCFFTQNTPQALGEAQVELLVLSQCPLAVHPCCGCSPLPLHVGSHLHPRGP